MARVFAFIAGALWS